MDEMCDFGYPQHTDAKVLKDYIYVKERHKVDIKPVQMTSQLTGAGRPIKYANIFCFVFFVCFQ